MNFNKIRIILILFYCFIIVGFSDCGTNRILLSYDLGKCSVDQTVLPQHMSSPTKKIYITKEKFENYVCTGFKNYIYERKDKRGKVKLSIETSLKIERIANICTLLSVVYVHGQNIQNNSSKVKDMVLKNNNEIFKLLFKGTKYYKDRYAVNEVHVFDDEEEFLQYCK